MSRTYRRTKNVSLPRRGYSDPAHAHHYIELKVGWQGWYRTYTELPKEDQAKAKANFQSDSFVTHTPRCADMQERQYRRKAKASIDKALRTGDYDSVIIDRYINDIDYYYY